MTTFSQLVDDVVMELLRPDLLVAAVSYVNQTMRELHFKPNPAGQSIMVHYDANRLEDEVPVNTPEPFLWTIPSTTSFQDMEAAYSPTIGLYIKPKNPRVTKAVSFEPNANVFWYRSGPSIAFAGLPNGSTLQISWFEYARSMGYRATADRVVEFDPLNQVYVRVGGGPAPTEAELLLETNWMLQRWGDSVVKEGLRAKLWKRVGEIERGRMAYSAFESARSGLWMAEPSSQ